MLSFKLIDSKKEHMDIKKLKNFKNISVNQSNQRVIKWIGSLLIIVMGISIAIYLTYKTRITEHTYYTLHLPEYLFAMKDSKKLKVKIGLGFDNYEAATQASKKQVELVNVLFKVFNEVDSKQVVDEVGFVKIKTIIMIELSKIKQPIEYVSFLSKPIIF